MMKTFALIAIAGTAMAANGQELLAWWNFNNSTNDSDGINENGNDMLRIQFGHALDNNDPFDDGFWDPTLDRLYPVSDAFAQSPGELIDIAGWDPGIGIPDAANYKAWIDVSNLVGNNDDTQVNNWLSYSGTALGMPTGTFAGGTLAITGDANNGSSFDIVADLTGWQDIEVSWAQRGTSSGFNSRTVSVSTDGVNFTQIFQDLGTLTSTFTQQQAFAGAALDNAANAIIRFTIDGTTSTNGNNRFDNIVLRGDVFDGTGPVCVGDIADDFGTLGVPDDQVTFGDFLALLGLIGPCPGAPGCVGDIADDFGTLGSIDGQVSFGDFLALLGLIGPCPL
jgi:hypothetical protein